MDFDFLVCSLLGTLSSMLLVWPPGGIFIRSAHAWIVQDMEIFG